MNTNTDSKPPFKSPLPNEGRCVRTHSGFVSIGIHSWLNCFFRIYSLRPVPFRGVFCALTNGARHLVWRATLYRVNEDPQPLRKIFNEAVEITDAQQRAAYLAAACGADAA